MKFSIDFQFSIELSRKNKTHNITFASWGRLRDQVRKRDKSICQYCGILAQVGTVDHVTPLSRGGTDAIDNLAWCCKSCNSSKGTKLLDEWSGRRATKGGVNATSATAKKLPSVAFPVAIKNNVAPAVVAVSGNIQDILASAHATRDTRITIREGDRRHSPCTVSLGDIWDFLEGSFKNDSWSRDDWSDRGMSQRTWADIKSFLDNLGFWRINNDAALANALKQLLYAERPDEDAK